MTKQERYDKVMAKIERLETKQIKLMEKMGRLREKAQNLLNKLTKEKSNA